jgi:hypothetical protein
MSLAGSADVKHVDGVSREESNIRAGTEDCSNFFSSFQLSEGDESSSSFNGSLVDDSSGLSISFGSNDNSLGFLFSHGDNVLGHLGLLESDLFHLNRLSEVSSKVKVSDGDIVEVNVELKASLL